jgi:hypothetical protein
LVWGSIYVNPEIWVNDYPPDIRAKFGRSEKKQRGKGRSWPVLFPSARRILIASLIRLPVAAGALTFLTVFLSLFLILMVFNLFDLLILDWLIGIAIHPKFMELPGTEGMAGYRDFWFPLRGFLIRTLGLLCESGGPGSR